MQQLILIVHVLTSLAIIALVLLQYGKGADVGASFGSGASNTMFGGAGAVPFLTKVTGSLAAVFFVTSLVLGFIASQQVKSNNELMSLPSQKPAQIPMQNK